MQILIKFLTGKKITLDVESADSIELVKQKIQEKEGLPTDQQRLVFEGRYLKDDARLWEYKIHKDSIVHVF